MRRTPYRKFCRLLVPMVQCEKCGEQFPLTEHRIGCHYIVYDRPIKAMGRDAGNFARTETVTMLAGKCDCGHQEMASFPFEAYRQLLLDHAEMVTKPEEDDILVQEVTELTN